MCFSAKYYKLCFSAKYHKICFGAKYHKIGFGAKCHKIYFGAKYHKICIPWIFELSGLMVRNHRIHYQQKCLTIAFTVCLKITLLQYDELTVKRHFGQRVIDQTEWGTLHKMISIFLKNRHFIIQKRFNKLIYGINTIIKCGTWQPIKFQLVFHSWNEMIFYLISELMLPTLIQIYDKKSFSF